MRGGVLRLAFGDEPILYYCSVRVEELVYSIWDGKEKGGRR